MAGSETGPGGNTGEMKAHVATYDLMIGLLKWGAVAVAILVAIVLWLIA
ncbi:aa3-type cytochrome c oxidase subunit IV [uncultured Sphingomonas sp.]|nr:aa3-type cytochrome c oxidase subunit IV [uncultured Sphingomonas sp.]